MSALPPITDLGKAHPMPTFGSRVYECTPLVHGRDTSQSGYRESGVLDLSAGKRETAKHNNKLLRINNLSLNTGRLEASEAICYSCYFPTKPLVARSFSLNTMLAKVRKRTCASWLAIALRKTRFYS